MNINDQIKNTIENNDIVLFMKGTPDFPQCGFSGKVVHLLKQCGVDFVGVNVLEDPELRQGIKEFSHWPTIPQLYIKGQFIGGCDIVTELYQNGELKSLLNPK